jgi:hypothetical protein
MALLHHKSEPVFDLVAKGMHHVPGTQVDSAENIMWNVTPSQESAAASTGGSVLNFLIPQSGPGLITLLADSYIKVTGYFLNAAAVINTTKTTVLPALQTAIFSECEITLNGVVIRPQTGFLTPYSVLMDTLVNEDRAWVDGRDYSGGFIWDPPNMAGESDPVLNSGSLKRQANYLLGTTAASADRSFSVMIPIRSLGLRTGDALPPGVDLRIRVTRSPNSFLTQGTAAPTTAAVLTLTTCAVYTRQIRLTQEAASALSMSLQKEAARLTFQRVRIASQLFATGTQDCYINGSLPGPRPKRVVAFYARQECINATATAGAYDLHSAVAFSNVYLTLGDSRYYPSQAMSWPAAQTAVDQQMSIAQLYEMYCSVAARDPAIPSSQITNLQMICFNTSRNGDTSGAAWDLSEEVSLDFHANLGAAPGAPFSFVLVSWTDGVIEIDGSGAVTVDV